ncbi:asparaginase [Deinococcus sp. Arct2-2]|uniref:isoaspartyl peptidase/L-asparaginase family protein n=1 Tax=Deinococcus sp. Arct2-2 TaxID=2568653 RepID=UPI0010A480BD|nr:isoaspartyl peptidase/L-asparaginase family protein [Deinococcus sp. Arct2-2]THF71476.1 asparaginase [Deinococcus sp. Arct2-2]
MTEIPPNWALILHGGAKEIQPEQEEANRRGCLAALAAGQQILETGGRALDAAEAVLRVLEDDPTFNAGFGSVPNADGQVEMDAALMEGKTLAVGAVAGIQGVRHPVSVARALLEETPTLLIGAGARRFAKQCFSDQGSAELCDPAEMLSPQQAASEAAKRAGHDTVGCVVLDQFGDLVTGTSTGGLNGTLPGRVGDSPLPGCGFYADNTFGAVALSGHGEAISRLMLASRIMHGLERNAVQTAVSVALNHLSRLNTDKADAGAVALDARGNVGWDHRSPHFAVAYATSQQPAQVYLKREDSL